MFAKLLIAPLIIATSVVAHPAIARRGDVSLADWSSQNLESYWSFKMRFTALGCSADGVPGTDFYTSCCYPLGASESLSARPAECTPTACSAPTASPSAASSPSVQSVPTDDDDEDDSNLPFCEEGQSEYDDGNDYNASSYTAPAPSSDNSQPAPSSDNSQPAPSSDDSQPAPSSDNSQPAPTQGTDTSSGNVNYGGFATYFYQGGNAGACGDFHSDSDLIAAIDHERYGDNFGVKSSECGRQVHIKNPANGNTVVVTIADVCPTCDNGNSIDLSEGAFKALADLGVGHMAIEWYYL